MPLVLVTASVLLSAGVSIKAVQANLGHASATVTLDTYGHLCPMTRTAQGPP